LNNGDDSPTFLTIGRSGWQLIRVNVEEGVDCQLIDSVLFDPSTNCYAVPNFPPLWTEKPSLSQVPECPPVEIERGQQWLIVHGVLPTSSDKDEAFPDQPYATVCQIRGECAKPRPNIIAGSNRTTSLRVSSALAGNG
jgi:hypothetical protein